MLLLKGLQLCGNAKKKKIYRKMSLNTRKPNKNNSKRGEDFSSVLFDYGGLIKKHLCPEDRTDSYKARAFQVPQLPAGKLAGSREIPPCILRHLTSISPLREHT